MLKYGIEYKIGDFVKVTNINTTSYYLYITNMFFFKEIGNILSKKSLKSITGIIVESSISFALFKKRTIFLKNIITPIKKITDKQKIEELQLKYKLHLLKSS